MQTKMKEFQNKVDHAVNFKNFKKSNRYTHENLIKDCCGHNHHQKDVCPCRSETHTFGSDSASVTNEDTYRDAEAL